MLKIGELTIHGRVLSAPFSGISNSPFRRLAKRHGAALVFTEMVKARPWVDRHPRTGGMISYSPEERPIIAQIASGDPDEASRTVELAFRAGFDGIDLNLGCPVKKISKSQCGAYLLGFPERIGEIVGAMERTARSLRSATRPFPVTAKMRAGLSSDVINAPTVAKVLEHSGAAAITIHARTKDQHHKGATRNDVVAEVKRSVRIPVFFNGSVNSPAIAKAIVDETGVDGVMIGRASFGNPWIFGKVEKILSAGQLDVKPPTLAEVKETLQWHFQAVRELFGDFTACRLMRRYGPWYIVGLHGSAKFRQAVSLLEDPAQFPAMLDELFNPFDPTTPAPLADWYDAPRLSGDPVVLAAEMEAARGGEEFAD